MIRKFAKFTAVLAALALFSCMHPDDIRILELEHLGMETMTKPVVTVRVRNDSRKNIRITEGRFTLASPSGRIGEVMLTDRIDIPKRSETSITLPIRIKISNPLAAASLAAGGGAAADRLTVTGEATVKAGAMKKKFAFDNAPFSRFLTIFGADRTDRMPDYENTDL
ncbi:MAG: hypothetical protein LIO77_00540 [Rikenellaceae bacterium]|nr:hypothetical protein [Rikenellaceae bacterium]